MQQKFRVSFYTFDCQIIDQSWAELTSNEIIVRLKAGLDGRVVGGLGKEWSRAYRESYIEYLEVGGKLIILPSVTSKLLYELLAKGPIFVCVCFNTLYGVGRTKDNVPDDVNGRVWNHSIVIYGNDNTGNLLVADPIRKPGLHIVEPERMIAAISTAQLECDNLLFQIENF